MDIQVEMVYKLVKQDKTKSRFTISHDFSLSFFPFSENERVGKITSTNSKESMSTGIRTIETTRAVAQKARG
jgi:hypothetical protein